MNWQQWTWLLWVWIGAAIGWFGCALGQQSDWVEEEQTISGQRATIYHQGRVWRCWFPELGCGVVADSYEQLIDDATKFLQTEAGKRAIEQDIAKLNSVAMNDMLMLMGAEGDNLPKTKIDIKSEVES